MEIIWRSNAELNPIGFEARLIDMGGERTLEATFSNNLSVKQKIKAIWKILTGRAFSVSEIYIGSKEDITRE